MAKGIATPELSKPPVKLHAPSRERIRAKQEGVRSFRDLWKASARPQISSARTEHFARAGGIDRSIKPREALQALSTGALEQNTKKSPASSETLESRAKTQQVAKPKAQSTENEQPEEETYEQQVAKIRKQALETLPYIIKARGLNNPEFTGQLQETIENATPQDLLNFNKLVDKRFSRETGRLVLGSDKRVEQLYKRIPEQLSRKLKKQGVANEVIAREIAGKQLTVLIANSRELRILRREFPRFPLLSLIWKILGLLGLSVTMNLAKQVLPENISRVL